MNGMRLRAVEPRRMGRIDEAAAEIVRAMTAAQKLAMVDVPVRLGRGLMASAVRADLPE